MVYYCFAASRIDFQRKIDFCIPTGNFGNIYAGYVAKKIGTNIDKLIVATNLNDILHRTITTGRYFKDKVYKTHSPSMDIQVSSNFERLLYHIYKKPNIVKKQMEELKLNGFYQIEDTSLNKLKDQFNKAKQDIQERFEDKVLKIRQGDELLPSVMKMVKVFVAIKRRLRPGDKMSEIGRAHV